MTSERFLKATTQTWKSSFPVVHIFWEDISIHKKSSALQTGEAKLQTQYYVGQADYFRNTMTRGPGHISNSLMFISLTSVHHNYTWSIIQTFEFHNSIIHETAPPYVCMKGIQTASNNGRHYVTVFAKDTTCAQKEYKPFRSKSSRQTQLYGYIRSMKTARC
jgi:hypothetical protein